MFYSKRRRAKQALLLKGAGLCFVGLLFVWAVAEVTDSSEGPRYCLPK